MSAERNKQNFYVNRFLLQLHVGYVFIFAYDEVFIRQNLH